jgi:hypothetical protein
LLRVLLLPLLLIVSGTVAAEEPIRIQDPIPFTDGKRIDPEMIESCDIQRKFTDAVVREMKGRIVAAPGPLSTAQGRALKLEIVDSDWSGNWFIGHLQVIKTRGTLYEDGRKVAGFEGMRQVSGGDLTSGCFNLNATFRAAAWDIKRWLKKPVDGARIGR